METRAVRADPQPLETISLASTRRKIGLELALDGVVRGRSVLLAFGSDIEHAVDAFELFGDRISRTIHGQGDFFGALHLIGQPAGVSMATTLPLLMITTRLQVMLTSGRMWVERMTV